MKPRFPDKKRGRIPAKEWSVVKGELEKLRQRAVERPSDVEMMQRPNLWNHWPLLPVKRVDARGGWTCAVMVETAPEARPVVYLCNMFAVDLDAAERIKYDSYEAVVADGWMVD